MPSSYLFHTTSGNGVHGDGLSLQGCCKVETSLSCETSKPFIKIIGKVTPSVSHIRLSLLCEKPQHDIVEDGEHLGGMSHAELSMVLVKSHIAAIMQSIFNSPMSSCQFEESFRISEMSRQAGYPIADLGFGYSKGIG